jgi:hypothetical protein
MQRRLVSVVCLVAFVFTNAAGAAMPHDGRSGHSSGCACTLAEPAVKQESAPSGCEHCRMSHEACKSIDNDEAICLVCGCSVLDGPCKCQTADQPEPCLPSVPKCPCPDGCTVCMAKMPCLVGTNAIPLETPCLEACLVEPASIYSEPFAGRLIRPPRA